MRDKILWLLAGVAIAACVIGGYTFLRAVDVSTARVDSLISDGITSADAELKLVEAHRPEVVTKIEVIRHETVSRILSLGYDELALVALSRAERFRSRIASADRDASTAGLAGR